MKKCLLFAGLALFVSAHADVAPASVQYQTERPSAVASAPHARPIYKSANPVPSNLGDIVLRDGLALSKARIIADTPLQVTLRYEGGIIQVLKTNLPETVTAKYPADYAAAKEFAAYEDFMRATKVAETASAESLAKEKNEKIRKERSARGEELVAEARADEQAKERERAGARYEAQKQARAYLRTQWRPGNNSTLIMDVRVSIDEFEDRTGWTGEWDVGGDGYIEYYTSSSGSFSSSRVHFSGTYSLNGGLSGLTVTAR